MMMQKNSIPKDKVFEILLRLPAKSIGRFICVSKLWARIICSEDFVRWFSLCSSRKNQKFLFSFHELDTVQKSPVPEKIILEIMFRLPPESIGRFTCLSKLWARTFTSGQVVFMNQPRLLFASNDIIKGYQEKWHFFSKTTPQFLSNTVCQLKKLRHNEPCYVHGLISFLYGQEQVVSNPTTGKSITLPSVITNDFIVRSFLGYDPISAIYKVLCLTNVTQFCNHQVLTLGSEAQNWRLIQCSTPHHPLGTNSVCIDGVLYYTASSSFIITKQFLVGFDLTSETLEIASILPEEIGSYKLHKTTLINYHGKVALVTQLDYYNTSTLWVLEDAKKQDWTKQVLSFPLNGTERHHYGLKMLGVSEKAEFVYAPIQFKELYIYFVDHISNCVTRVELLGNTKHNFRDFYKVFTFLNHVESLMFI